MLTHLQNRISEIVRSLDTLRTLRLNLDYAYQDAAIPQPRARADDDDNAYKSRWASAEELVLYGSEILTILERREGFHVLEELYLLYCDPNTCRRWVRFLPSRYPGTVAERIDWGLDPESLYVVASNWHAVAWMLTDCDPCAYP